jgi:hypothetical protein
MTLAAAQRAYAEEITVTAIDVALEPDHTMVATTPAGPQNR